MGSCLWVQAVWYNLLSVLFFLLRLGMLILSLPLLRLNFKPTSLNPELCVARTRQYNAICWKFDLFPGFYVFSWLISGVAWRRWEMLSQRLAADPRYKLNISSFLTLPHPLDCLIFAKDIIVSRISSSLCCYCKWWWDKVGGGSFKLWFGWQDREWVSHFFYFLFCFCAVVNCSFMAGAW